MWNGSFTAFFIKLSIPLSSTYPSNHNNVYLKQTNINIGQQEYSSRQAGITFGIVLAVIIPLVLLLVYAGYKILQKRKAEEEEDDNADLVYQENLR